MATTNFSLHIWNAVARINAIRTRTFSRYYSALLIIEEIIGNAKTIKTSTQDVKTLVRSIMDNNINAQWISQISNKESNIIMFTQIRPATITKISQYYIGIEYLSHVFIDTPGLPNNAYTDGDRIINALVLATMPLMRNFVKANNSESVSNFKHLLNCGPTGSVWRWMPRLILNGGPVIWEFDLLHPDVLTIWRNIRNGRPENFPHMCWPGYATSLLGGHAIEQAMHIVSMTVPEAEEQYSALQKEALDDVVAVGYNVIDTGHITPHPTWLLYTAFFDITTEARELADYTMHHFFGVEISQEATNISKFLAFNITGAYIANKHTININTLPISGQIIEFYKYKVNARSAIQSEANSEKIFVTANKNIVQEHKTNAYTLFEIA